MDNLTILPMSSDMLEDLIRKVLSEILSPKAQNQSLVKPFLTTKEACEMLRMSRQTLHKLRKIKRITPIQDSIGGKILYKYEDVINLNTL
jgi:excisionase family DNA binding protein